MHCMQYEIYNIHLALSHNVCTHYRLPLPDELNKRICVCVYIGNYSSSRNFYFDAPSLSLSLNHITERIYLCHCVRAINLGTVSLLPRGYI